MRRSDEATATTLPVALDGITPLPAGTIATIKTYLHRTARYTDPASPLPPGVTLERLDGRARDRYRRIFATLGERWLWWSRLLLDDAALAAILDDPAVEAFAIRVDGADAGLLEWDRRAAQTPELAFLGLYETALRRGIGHALMAQTLHRLWQDPIACVQINTCTFDHPAALAFYQRWGFTAVARSIEIVPDPRLCGVLPATAAPHVSVLRSS